MEIYNTQANADEAQKYHNFIESIISNIINNTDEVQKYHDFIVGILENILLLGIIYFLVRLGCKLYVYLLKKLKKTPCLKNKD